MQYPKLPAECPECGHHFSEYTRPRSRMSLKAVLLVLVGVMLCVPWVLILAGVANMAGVQARGVIGPTLLALLPALGAGFVAGCLPRVLRMKCVNCGWQQTYKMSK